MGRAFVFWMRSAAIGGFLLFGCNPALRGWLTSLVEPSAVYPPVGDVPLLVGVGVDGVVALSAPCRFKPGRKDRVGLAPLVRGGSFTPVTVYSPCGGTSILNL